MSGTLLPLSAEFFDVRGIAEADCTLPVDGSLNPRRIRLREVSPALKADCRDVWLVERRGGRLKDSWRRLTLTLVENRARVRFTKASNRMERGMLRLLHYSATGIETIEQAHAPSAGQRRRRKADEKGSARCL